ncbi:hypothetical protein V6N13_110134 [Hibiscus sabdariffa]|uniref:Uncharacterized protein n=1 Tax=Hibiscus sabdariffa TaxID=183260 RepID=A0ABR2BU59_9ROSI
MNTTTYRSRSLKMVKIAVLDPSPESEWIISIKEKLEQARQDDAAGSWERLSIYRVPHYLREDDIKSYVPQFVSLGPYHHGKKHLRQMDQHKWSSLHRVLKRTNMEIQVYLDSMTSLRKWLEPVMKEPSLLPPMSSWKCWFLMAALCLSSFKALLSDSNVLAMQETIRC